MFCNIRVFVPPNVGGGGELFTPIDYIVTSDATNVALLCNPDPSEFILEKYAH